VVKLISTTSAN